MKKLVCIILAVLMTLLMCACTQQKQDQQNNEGTTQGTTQDTTPETTQAQTQDPTALNTISQIGFSVNGVKLNLGMKLSQLMDSGAFAEIIIRDSSLEPISSGGVTAKVDAAGRYRMTIYLWNLTRDTIDIQDATVVGISYNLGEDEIPEGKIVEEVVFSGIRLDKSVESLIQFFGQPNVKQYTYDNETGCAGAWSGFDIKDQFRLYLRAEQTKGKPIKYFMVQFKPFTDNIA